MITGASAGVGRATAVVFARRGWNVALLARSEPGLHGAAADVRGAGAEALVVPIDVSDAGSVFAAAERVMGEWGRIDVWVNNAMVTVFGPVAKLMPDEVRRVTEVTYLGCVFGTMAALKAMKRDGGTIVQVGSALSYRAIPLQAAYCGAKFAIRGFTDALRSELQRERTPVRLTMVQLPAVNTPQFDWARNKLANRAQPLAPIHQPEPIAEIIFQAAQAAPRELWVGWPSVRAIIGAILLPGTLDRLLATIAWDGQLANEPRLEDRADNLYSPPPHGHAARGRFDRQATPSVRSFNPLVLRFVVASLGVAVATMLAIYVSLQLAR